MPLQSKTRYRLTPAMVREGIRVLGKRSVRQASAASTWQTKAKTRRGPRGDQGHDASYTLVGQVGPAYMKRKRNTLDRDLSLVSLLSLPDEELILCLHEFSPHLPMWGRGQASPVL